jgi:formate dehydrogenase maturation protein FdhE
MNDRIKELRKQAAMEVCNANQWTNDDEWNDLFMAKFAELIVNACAEVAKNSVRGITTLADAEFVSDQINQHFGVK